MTQKARRAGVERLQNIEQIMAAEIRSAPTLRNAAKRLRRFIDALDTATREHERLSRPARRGKVVGYVGISGMTVMHDVLLTREAAEEDEGAVSGSYRVARVVLVPKKKAPGKARRRGGSK